MSTIGKTVWFFGGGYKAYTSAQSGVTYMDGIGGLTCTELNKVAKAIKRNTSITNNTAEVWVDTVNRHISVGDTISITVDSTAYDFCVMGFNHYAGAGMLFQMVKLLPTTATSVATNGDTSGWSNLPLRTTVEDYLSSFPSEWREIIKQVNIPCATDVNTAAIVNVAAKLFIPSSVEVFASGSGTGGANEGTRYKWYALNSAASNRIKQNGTTAAEWWLRTCGLSLGNAVQYRVSTSGSISSVQRNTSNKARIAPCFCV